MITISNIHGRPKTETDLRKQAAIPGRKGNRLRNERDRGQGGCHAGNTRIGGRSVLWQLGGRRALATPAAGTAHDRLHRESDGSVRVDFEIFGYALRRRRQARPATLAPKTNQMANVDGSGTGEPVRSNLA